MTRWETEREERAFWFGLIVWIDGNPGHHRNLADGVSELKIDFGPGYRVYYAQRATRLLLLLGGGDKSTQQKDIATAIKLAKDFKE